MLGEDSHNFESDDESSDADVQEADLEEINSIVSDQEISSPEDSSSDEDNELDDSFSTGEHFERNGEIWLRCYLTEQSEQMLQIYSSSSETQLYGAKKAVLLMRAGSCF